MRCEKAVVPEPYSTFGDETRPARRAMDKTTLKFPNASAEVAVVDHVISVRVNGAYTDDVALALLRHLEPVIDQIPGDPVRVWDASKIPPDKFKLSNGCIDAIAQWARRLREKKPGSLAYMVGPTRISYGMSRMYEMKADLDPTGVVVVHSLDELPGEIRRRVPF